jgi:diaminohydroxyphosphoribosylaminopyrimidine deaminase/5-amino-6-(5-phosphoribosylamino)uracil reductase
VEQGLLDELVVYSAPILLGPDARAMLQLPPLARLADRLQFELLATERIDDDLKLVLRPRKAPAS